MRFVTRAGWGAKPPRSRVAASPSLGSTLHYEGPRMGDFPHTSCAPKVRGIQSFHMAPVADGGRGWSDIAYTAVVCPHGWTFEGRWVGVRNGANGTNPGNRDAYAVCSLMGAGDPVPVVMLAELAEVFAYLDRDGGAGSKLNGHRDWKPTACPGEELYRHLDELRARKTAILGGAGPAPIPSPTVHDLEELLMAVAKNDDDARRAHVRARCRAVLGRPPKTWDEFVLFLGILTDRGADELEIALAEQPDAIAYVGK